MIVITDNATRDDLTNALTILAGRAKIATDPDVVAELHGDIDELLTRLGEL